MGIRIQRNTWRAPLQLIDCWLPAPTATAISSQKSAKPLPALAERFARAGWLGRDMRTPAMAEQHLGKRLSSAALPSRDGHMPSARTPAVAARSSHADARVLLSGRLADVSAELERLAAHDQTSVQRRH